MDTSQLERIKGGLLAKHGSLEEPDFHFRWEAIKNRPYRGLIDEVLAHFYMRDATELNQDGSFVYTILGRSDVRWMLQLSMVGPYGVIFRTDGLRPTLVVESSLNLTSEELVLLKLVRKHEIALLDEGTLVQPISLKLDYTDPENVCIYQALFSDTDALPWERPTELSKREARFSS